MQENNNNRFVMSFWGYRRFMAQDTVDSVKMWKEAGFNVGFSFVYRQGKNHKSEMIKLLDECEKNDLKLILYDDRIHCHRLMEMSEEEYESAVIRSVEEFGRHPAAFAFFVSDEPNKNTLPLAEKAVSIVRKNSPIPAFVNFYPMWRTEDYIDLLGVQGGEIDKIYTPFINNSGLRCLSYDCYSAMNAREPEGGTDAFFDNLNVFYATADKNGVPLWTSLLCTGHWYFKQPLLTDMRWQLSAALAHGVQGVQWFMLYDNEDKLGDSPIDIYNERQPSYYDLKKVNREFSADADFFAEAHLEKVYHYGKSYGKTPLYVNGAEKLLREFSLMYEDFSIISRFRHKKTNRVWYMFVNGSLSAGNYFSYKFVEEYKHADGGKWLEPGKYFLIELREKDVESY